MSNGSVIIFPALQHTRIFPRTAEIKPAKGGSRCWRTLLARKEISANTAFASFPWPVGKMPEVRTGFLPESKRKPMGPYNFRAIPATASLRASPPSSVYRPKYHLHLGMFEHVFAQQMILLCARSREFRITSK